jgi:serine protease Do
VIVKADGKEVKTVEDFRKILETASGSVKVEGMYPGYEGIYPIVINLSNAN